VTFWVEVGWAATAGSLVTLFGIVAWMLVRRRWANTTDEDADSSGFTLENYGPMERLLAEEDFLFLQSQPGYDSKMGARWKRERRRVFRLYLAELKRDFWRLHAEARSLVAHAGADSGDLVTSLMWQQWSFLRASASLEMRLAFEWAGIGKIDAAPLLELLEAMRIDLAHRTALHPA